MVSTGGAEAAATVSKETVREGNYFEGQLDIAVHNFDAAIQKLQPMTEEKDCPPEVYVALADAYSKSGNAEKSLETLKTAIDLHPEFIPTWHLRAGIYRRKGETQKAIDDLEQALRLEPKNPDTLEELGLLRLRAIKNWTPGGSDQAAIDRLIEIYSRLLDAKTGSERVLPLLVLTSAYTRMGRYDKAIEMAKESVHIRPQDIRGHLALAESYEVAGRRKDSLDAYRQALLIEPGSDQIRAKIGELVTAVGAPGGLLAFYDELSQSFPKVLEIQELYGEELLKAEKWQKAADHFQKAMKLWPDNKKFKASLVRAYLSLGKQEEAMSLAKGLIDDPNASDKDMLDLASTLRGAGQADSVVQLMKRVAALHPDDYRISLQLAGVQIEAGKTDDAMKTLEEIAKKHPEAFAAVAMLGSLYTDAGRFDDAQALYDRATASVPKERARDLRMLRAQLYRQQGKSDDAIKILEEVMAQDGDIPILTVQMLLELYAQKGNFDAAHKTIDKYIAQAEDKEKIDGKRLKAWVYWRANDYPKAIEILEDLHTQSPSDYDIVKFLVETYADAGKFDQAQGVLDASEQLVGENYTDDLSLLRARIYKDRGKVEDAIKVVEKLMTKNTRDERFFLVAGEYYHDAGHNDEAERVLRQAIQINPKNAEAYNALGYFFAEAGTKLDEAKTLVEKALELNPGAGHILDSLGWIYFQKGDYPKAVETLQSAINRMKDSPDPVVLDHLGDAYLKAGNTDRAHEVWERSLKINPKQDSVRAKLK